MEMVDIREITVEQWAALFKFLGPYATQSPFPPVPLRQVRAVAHKILGLRTEAGAYTDKVGARKTRLQAGIDPRTFEVVDSECFEVAISRAVEAVGNMANGKSQAGSNGESSPEGEVLTPLATGQLRAIKAKLGARRAPEVSRYTNSPCRGFSEGGEPGRCNTL